MIQRIQSLWLLLASLSVCLLFFFSVTTFEPNPESANSNRVEFTFFAYGLDYENCYSYTMEKLDLYAALLKYTVIAVALVCILTPLFSVFRYKNRPQQMQLSRLTMLLNVALMVTFFLLSDFFAKKSDTLVSSYGIGIYVPIGAIVFLLLAIRCIKKDDKLVRSADRIR
jgi:hypothetical protein